MGSSFLPTNLHEWLQLFSAAASISVVAFPFMVQRLGRAKRERDRMHAENIKRFDAIEDLVGSVDLTLKIQNGRIKRLEARADAVEAHIWNGIDRRHDST